VAKALSTVPNVIHAESSKAQATASLWTIGSISIPELIATVESLGYTAELDPKLSKPHSMLHIEGMMCQMSCGTTVGNALKSVVGVTHAVASFDDGDARIWVNDMNSLDESKLINAVEEMGFGASHKSIVWPPSAAAAAATSTGSPSSPSATTKKSSAKAEKIKQQHKENAIREEAARRATESALAAANLPVIKLQCSGISCAVCCGKIEKHLREMNGVKLVTVNPVTHVCSVGFHKPSSSNSNAFVPKPPNAHDLIHEVVSLGYGAREIMANTKGDSALDRLNSTDDLDEWRSLFLMSVAFTLPLFLLQYFFLSFTEAYDIVGGITLKELLMFCVATPMQFKVGRKYYIAAYLGYQHGIVGMDFLVSLGVGGSYLNSCVILALQSIDPMFDKPVMFETAVCIVYVLFYFF
jgi:cation transport ATPase